MNSKRIQPIRRFSNSKSGDEVNRLKGAQCVENGSWLSRHDWAGETLAWIACGTNDRRLKIGSKKARATESPRSRGHDCGRSGRCGKQVVFTVLL